MGRFLGIFGDKPETVDAAVGLLEIAEERFGACQVERDAALGRVDALEAENERLKAQLATSKAAATVLRREAKALKAARPAKARLVAPLAEDQLLSPDDLLALIGGADIVELVFSNGKREIAGIDPMLISGDAWGIGIAGLQLRVPELMVHGPAGGKAPYLLAGYGLLLDGELAAYGARGDVLAIAPGARMNLAQDVVF